MKHYNAKKLALLLVHAYHGSGIDCDWYINENKSNIILSNSIHCMDDNGYYEGYMDFSVRIDKLTAKVKRIMFHTNSFYRRNYVWRWKDYLEQLFYDPEFRCLYTYTRPYYLKWDIK